MTNPCRYSHQDLSSLIRSGRTHIFYAGPQASGDISGIEERFNLSLPSEYKQFLGNYGSLRATNFAIFGLGDREKIGHSVADLTFVIRLRNPSFPKFVIPVESLGSGRFACLVCAPEHKQFGQVVEIDPRHLDIPTQWTALSTCFRDYLYERLKKSIEAVQSPGQDGWERFEWHVQHYQEQNNYDHAKGGKLPRNHDWRPYRFCVQDVVFALTVVQHDREKNCLVVDVFLTAEIPQYDPLAGTLALTSFTLSEAYKCGGTMEIRFTGNIEGGRVPKQLQALAERYSIHFEKAEKGRIEAAESKALYAAITDFSLTLQQKINYLEERGHIKMARACYVVNHGVWTREQIEMIVLGSEYPDSILGGMSQPHQRHRYQHDILHARAALLGGMLDRTLARRERITEDHTTYDMEDDVRPLEINFDSVFYAKGYLCDDEIPIPWLFPNKGSRHVSGGMPFHVLIRARDVADMAEHMANDIEQARQLRTQTNTPVFLLTPYDFVDLDVNIRQYIQTRLDEAQIGLLVCPESLSVFDNEAAQKLARSRILRQ